MTTGLDECADVLTLSSYIKPVTWDAEMFEYVLQAMQRCGYVFMFMLMLMLDGI